MQDLSWGRRAVAIAGAMALLAGIAACSSGTGKPVLTWYINPDNGTQEKLAKKCTTAAGGRYQIKTALLPRESSDQRDQLVRRLAAQDSGIDLMSLDVPYLAEFANAGFVHKFSQAERDELTKDMLEGPLNSALWKDSLYGVPFNANTQLLWVRKKVAEKAGLDLASQLTWDQVIDAAEQTKTTVQVQAKRYEGYTVLINSLVTSAGGEILKDPEAGKEVTPGINSPAGEEAARVLRKLGNSSAAAADIGNSNEGTAQAGFLLDNGGFMVNWPFVYTAATGEVAKAKESGDEKAAAAAQAVVDDFGWSRWPTVKEGSPSKPPLGGINLAIGEFSEHPEMAVEAVKCITSPSSQKEYMLGEGLLATVKSVYDDPDVTKNFPMADLLRESVDDAAPRPITPFYPDVTAAIQRTWHPPASVGPKTPQQTADLIVAVLHDKELI